MAFTGLAATPVITQTRTYPGVIGVDDRKIVERNDPFFAAVGRINITGPGRKRRCTGTLIAPDRVVTAAQCLVNSRDGTEWPAGHVHFIPNQQLGNQLVHAKAKCFGFPDLPYKHEKVFAPKLANNIAVIVLDKQLPTPTISLAPRFYPSTGLSLTHAAFPNSRNPRLRAHYDCRLLGEKHGLLMTDCDTTGYTPGGPVLLKTEFGHQLAAVMAGFVADRFTIAVPAFTKSWVLQDTKCQ